MKKKSDENGTFNNQTFTCPVLLFWRTFQSAAFMDGGGTAGKVLLRGQFGVPLTVWKEKQRGGRRNHTFIPSLDRMLFLELSLWILRSRFFCFLISHDCVCCT